MNNPKRYKIIYPEEIIEDVNGEWIKFQDVKDIVDCCVNSKCSPSNDERAPIHQQDKV